MTTATMRWLQETSVHGTKRATWTAKDDRIIACGGRHRMSEIIRTGKTTVASAADQLSKQTYEFLRPFSLLSQLKLIAHSHGCSHHVRSVTVAVRKKVSSLRKTITRVARQREKVTRLHEAYRPRHTTVVLLIIVHMMPDILKVSALYARSVNAFFTPITKFKYSKRCKATVLNKTIIFMLPVFRYFFTVRIRPSAQKCWSGRGSGQ
jgi:hypothetical protein